MTENDPQDQRARNEADAAAAEAGSIGGRRDPDEDPADQAVEEAGGGESEGFEQAEKDLIEHAEHGDPAPDPTSQAFTPEVESDRETTERGEADEALSEERPELAEGEPGESE
jgi:hypothetical protein